MGYFLLLNILPIDIVYYIYLINKSYKILKKFISKSINNRYYIRNFINSILSRGSLSLLLNNNFIGLKTLYYERINIRRYELLYLLNSLCNKLNIISEYVNNNFNDNTYAKYRRFKKYLIKICIKYNIKISLDVIYDNYYYKELGHNILLCNERYESLVIPARKLFKKDGLIPTKYTRLCILDDNYIFINVNSSNNYIKDFL